MMNCSSSCFSPIGIEHSLLKIDDRRSHELHRRVRRHGGYVKPTGGRRTIDKRRMNVIGEILARSNLGEHPPRQHRSRYSERLVVAAVRQWTAVIAEYVVGWELRRSTTTAVGSIRNPRRCRPLVVAPRKLAD